MTTLRRNQSQNQHGAALIIVLAFVVLLTGLVVANFSRTVTDRQVAHGSSSQTRADQLALSAADLLITDLKQEIVDGSTSPAPVVGGANLYTPKTNSNMLPARSGKPPLVGGIDPVPNLIRRSVQSDPILPPGVTSRASAVSSATASGNGRLISPTRWNRHYLIPKSNPVTDDSIPVGNFAAPDWVFVTNQGPAVLGAPSAATIGRYAYAIYDEGGLLDINVAGYPFNTSIAQYGRKGSVAFADLTALGLPNAAADDPKRVDQIVGWRNYASAQPTPVDTSSPFPKFGFPTASADKYFTFVTSNTTGFLSTSGLIWNGTGPTRTDQAFLNRQELINFRVSSGFTANALQYLTHFSREADANAPQWSPAAPTAPNPNFQTLRVAGTTGFTRNDGISLAKPGDPYVNKRFLLQRLNWLTYKGPSASRDGIANNKPLEADVALLTGTYGMSLAFLKLGTATNIVKYFGLFWDGSEEQWHYIGHPAIPNGSSPLLTVIPVLDTTLTSKRDADLFELLQAALPTNSLGYFVPSDPTLPTTHQQSSMLHILTIGANLIAQARTDCYPVRIACSVNGASMAALGRPRLPYLNSLAACPVAGTGITGGVNWLLVPNLWDPYRDTWDLTETTTLTPAYLRPPVRITVSGGVGFGTVASSLALQSGIVPTTSTVTPFASTVAGINSSLNLTTGPTIGNSSGRDGLRQPSRLGTSDVATATTLFVPTTSPASPASASWNNITRPPRPDATVPGSDNFVVFRLSLPGSGIPASVNTPPQNPVLILKPGFQMTVDYQSPNGQWYPYSFLQGNNATSTWISASNAANPSLNLTTVASQYGLNPAPTPGPPATAPTVLKSGAATPWDVVTLAQAPMFAKGDPRSIRYNSQVGVVSLANPPVSAGVIGSIWPDTYATPPPMFNAGFPAPTPTPTPTPIPTPVPTPTPTPGSNPNPASYSQVGDNGTTPPSNPYNEVTGDGVRPIIMNRPFRSVGEMSYAFRDQPFKTLDFSSANSPDAGLLDLFSVNEYNDASGMRAGAVNLNGRQAGAFEAVLKNTIAVEGIPGAAAPSPSPITNVSATNVGASLASSPSPAPIVNRAGLTDLIANQTGLPSTLPKTQREAMARALGEVGQTRTWNLMIDVIAQSGRYAPGETALAKFNVDGEQRYWVHVAIDRFTGQVIDRQVEVVKE